MLVFVGMNICLALMRNIIKKTCICIMFYFHRLKHVGALYSYVSGMLGANAHLIQMYHRSTPDSIQQDILTAFKDSSSTLRVVICSSSFSMGM